MDHPQDLTASDRYWFDLVQKCRTSGKSDHQWLQENNIKPPTFYYHVKQLRKKSCGIPQATRRVSKPEIQEVVPVFFQEEALSVPTAPVGTALPEGTDHAPAIRLQVHGICVEISNAASQIVIHNTLSALRKLC